MSKYLEVSVVAMKLNVSTSTIYRLIQCGELKSVKCGAKKGIRILVQSLADFEKRRREN